MNNKFAAIFDLHITETNRKLVLDSCQFVVDTCFEEGIDDIIVGGDWFDSRSQQGIESIETFWLAIEILMSNANCVYSISGNHDKQDLSASRSYVSAILGSSEQHSFDEGEFTNFERPSTAHIKGIPCLVDMYPYFPEHNYPKHDLKPSKDRIAICHASFVGAKNLGHVSKSGFSPAKFKNYGLTLVGHFHNRHELDHNVHYAGSLYPTSFGEDNDKGIAIVDTDTMSVDYIQNTSCPHYHTHLVELDEDGKYDELALEKVIDDLPEKDFHRVEFIGSRHAIQQAKKTVDKSVKIKSTVESIDEEIDVSLEIDFDETKIKEEFEVFALQKKIPKDSIRFKLGKKLLN